MGDFPFITWLARDYKQRAEKLFGENRWRKYLQAHGLANYVLIKFPSCEDEYRRLVYDIEESWYENKHPLTYNQYKKLTDEHKNSLKKVRDEAMEKFELLENEASDLDSEDVFGKTSIEASLKFANHVLDTNHALSCDFVAFFGSIINSSVKSLTKIGQTAPCDFAVFGLGSIARGEATPYSDLEYGFVVGSKEGEESEFFTKLAMDSYFRIGNLGDTPLQLLEIEELNDWDDDFKSGVSIDGITENSGSLPTGNGLKDSPKLTLTVEGYKELYKNEASANRTMREIEKKPGDKSYMLSSTILIYATDGDKSALYDHFVKAMDEAEANVLKSDKNVIQNRWKTFTANMKEFKFMREFVEYQPPRNMGMQVKREIFRYPTMLANNLKMCLGVRQAQARKVYEELQTEEHLSSRVKDYLTIVLAFSIYIRTSAYLNQKGQIKHITLLQHPEGFTTNLYCVSSRLFVILGTLLLPIKRSIKSSMAKYGSKNVQTTGLEERAKSILRQITIAEEDRLPKVEVYHYLSYYGLALEELRKYLDTEEITSASFADVLAAIRAKDQSNEQTCKVATRAKGQRNEQTQTCKLIKLASYLLYHMHHFKPALDYFSWLIDNASGHRDKTLWKLQKADCMKEAGDLQGSGKVLGEAITDWKKLMDELKAEFQQEKDNRQKGSGNSPSTGHHDDIHRLTNFGGLFLTHRHYDKSLDCYELATSLCYDIYGRNADHADTATIYLNVGEVYLCSGNKDAFALALSFFSTSLAMYESLAMCGKNTNLAKAHSYGGIGHAYDKLGDYDTAIVNFDCSLDMYRRVYGDANHPDIARVYDRYGIAYSHKQNHTEALRCYKKSLEIYKATQPVGKHRLRIATVCQNIGNAHAEEREYNDALKYYEESYEIQKDVYGTRIPNVAEILESMGIVKAKMRTLQLE